MMLIRRKLISGKVEELLHTTAQEKPAINVDVIAKYLEIKIERSPAPSEDISGFLMIENNIPVIGLNSDNSELRQRFTLGHEIGHFVLQHHLGKGTPHIDKQISVQFRNSTSSTGVKVEEMEANLFAAELLMPAEMLARTLQRYSVITISDDDDDTIKSLAQEYQVSAAAMTVRLSSLGYLKM